jgi:hypothetical protein
VDGQTLGRDERGVEEQAEGILTKEDKGRGREVTYS